MVCLKQLSFATAVVLSIVDTAVALPTSNHGSNAALERRSAYPESSLRFPREAFEERDFENDFAELASRSPKLNSNKFNNFFKMLNLGNAVASTSMARRDLEERDFKELMGRTVEDLDARDLEERKLAVLKKAFQATGKAIKKVAGGARKTASTVAQHDKSGKWFGNALDAGYTVATTVGTGKAIAKNAKASKDAKATAAAAGPNGAVQPGTGPAGGTKTKRTLEELERRAFEDLIRELTKSAGVSKREIYALGG
ncbi:unnamed protein product [Clonostachys rosea]|uniref:RxLR effector protein n=1 Tax=Bionectria ochroleuca TaxID=29856 RepID=A0ABY6V0M4_BIOOC|nr:unnamed protein product [Clonostachys rosea]